MQKYRAIGLSLPKEFMQMIDSERGDISRSKYLFRILERAYGSGLQTQEKPSDDRLEQFQSKKKVGNCYE